MGNPAEPSPPPLQWSGGSSILPLLDAIPAPLALLAIVGGRGHRSGRIVADCATPGVLATGRLRRSGRGDTWDDPAGPAQCEPCASDHDLAVRAYLDFFGNPDPKHSTATFWNRARRRAVATAYVSEFLCRQNRAHRLDRAFAAGLLHDIGMPALASVLPKSYRRVIEDFERSGRPLCEVERAVLGTDHTAAGAHLLLRWGACRALQNCARLHHLPRHALTLTQEQVALAWAVNAADAIVAVADGEGASWARESHALEAGDLPGLGGDVMDEATKLAQAKLAEPARSNGLAGRYTRCSDAPPCSDGLGGAAEPALYAGARSAVAPERLDWGRATRRLLQGASEFWLTTDVFRAAAQHLVQVTGLTPSVVIADDLQRKMRSVAFAAAGRAGEAFRCALDHPAGGRAQASFPNHIAGRETVALQRFAPACD
ncbi:MAG: HDOD domain-containing protein, partial [Phycisphaerae bacterium]